MHKSIASLQYLVVTITVLPALQQANAQKLLTGHVPAAARSLASIGAVPQENRLQLAFGLPVRDQAALDTISQRHMA